MNFKNYFWRFALSLTSLIVLVALFNRLVDPFWFYGDPTIPGFNTPKVELQTYERHIKPTIVLREQPDVLIFGSSYSEIGLDPLNPVLRSFGNSYNFGMAGAKWDRVLCNVEFAISHDANLHLIILGIHPQEMPMHSCMKQIEKMEHTDQLQFILSVNALQASIKTLQSAVSEMFKKTRMPDQTAEGRMFYYRGKPGTAARFGTDLHKCNFQPTDKISATDAAHPDSIDISGLSDIVQKAYRHGIAMKLYIYPRQAMAIERDYQCGVDRTRWNALAQIVSMVKQKSKDTAEVWDFEGYHDIGTEAITNAPGFWWQDPAHFNSEFGDIMLGEMFGKNSPRYGMRLSSTNLTSWENAKRQQRSNYIASRPDFVRQLNQLSP